MLDEFSHILYMNRQYLASLLRKALKVIIRKGKVVLVADPSVKSVSKRGRKRIYGEQVKMAFLDMATYWFCLIKAPCSLYKAQSRDNL